MQVCACEEERVSKMSPKRTLQKRRDQQPQKKEDVEEAEKGVGPT